ncbi:BA75_03865T0 [Komagataella pastoris]|uniref:BA75_03865T0 n=1 Tax=Komagataella pastoris TaxID=4922 RepID=A0A1B2JG44_PICPA|nr:BA75_03865T0 [Komagataella pastoris]
MNQQYDVHSGLIIVSNSTTDEIKVYESSLDLKYSFSCKHTQVKIHHHDEKTLLLVISETSVKITDLDSWFTINCEHTLEDCFWGANKLLFLFFTNGTCEIYQYGDNNLRMIFKISSYTRPFVQFKRGKEYSIVSLLVRSEHKETIFNFVDCLDHRQSELISSFPLIECLECVTFGWIGNHLYTLDKSLLGGVKLRLYNIFGQCAFDYERHSTSMPTNVYSVGKRLIVTDTNGSIYSFDTILGLQLEFVLVHENVKVEELVPVSDFVSEKPLIKYDTFRERVSYLSVTILDGLTTIISQLQGYPTYVFVWFGDVSRKIIHLPEESLQVELVQDSNILLILTLSSLIIITIEKQDIAIKDVINHEDVTSFQVIDVTPTEIDLLLRNPLKMDRYTVSVPEQESTLTVRQPASMHNADEEFKAFQLMDLDQSIKMNSTLTVFLDK